jgi:hypothetical protein
VVTRAIIRLTQYNICNETTQLDLISSKEWERKSFEVSSRLTSARLTTNFVLAGEFDVNVDVTWSGVGLLDSSRENIHNIDFGPECKLTSHFSSLSRSVTVSGNVYDPSDAETNFTPGPGQGGVFSIENGSVLIGTGCPS